MAIEVDWVSASIALYAAIIATGALALEVRRWFETGPRLSLSIMVTAMTTADADLPDSEREKFTLVTVVNNGSAPTTVTHIVLAKYDGWVSRWRRKPSANWFVANNILCPLPFTLNPAKIFHGQINHDRNLIEQIKSDKLYVGVVVTHKKHAILKRVRSRDFKG